MTRRGHVKVEKAKLYTRPRQAPLLVGAAMTEKTTEWLGGWADALLTTSRPPEELRKMVEAFRRGGGEGTDEARLGAHQQWRAVAFPNELLAELRTPKEFDQAGLRVRPEDMDGMIRISGSLNQHAEWIAQDIAIGFEEIILHNINTNQEEFIEAFGSKVLPQLANP